LSTLEDELASILNNLKAELLSGMWRYAGRQVFEFGVQAPHINRKGKEITLGKQSLVVSCDWRLWEGPEMLLTSTDFTPERRDQDGYRFYELLLHQPPRVEAILVQKRGGLQLSLTDGFVLEIVPTADVIFHEGFLEDEQWRYLPEDENASQLVITNTGYEFLDLDEFTALVARSMQKRKPEKQQTDFAGLL
jgi:hypothetical protein